MRELVLATVTLAALWWPSRVAGLLDGAPLTGQVEAILLGFVAPILWWFDRRFFTTRRAQILVAALIACKIAAAVPTQEGWCVRFDPTRPIVHDTLNRPHSWDVRADWRSDIPECSAVMTAAYTTFKEFPVWFFNLPPPDNNLPTFEDRPPGATLGMTVTGFINAADSGLLELVTGQSMDMTLLVDGQRADHPNALSHRIQLGPGVHFVQASGTLTLNHWQFMPSWNRALIGASGFPATTIARPGSLDAVWLRSGLRWITTIVALALMALWAQAALGVAGTPLMLGWAAFASVVLGFFAPRVGNAFALSQTGIVAISLLAVAALVTVPERFRTLRGLFVLIGMPWLVFIGTGAVDHAGKFSLYSAGDDWWMYQRLSYRTFLEGYFFEGGQRAFIHQPLYRWIAGGLHMLFGDSSMGEFLWDGVCYLAIALFAAEMTRRLSNLKWAIAAAAIVLTIVMRGPMWPWWGIGLSENSSAGLMSMAALAAMSATGDGQWLAAGVLATLGFLARMNNLAPALMVAGFAIPLATPAADAWRPWRWVRSVDWRGAAIVIGCIAAGMLLLAFRNLYYNHSFSLTYGSQFAMLSIWQSSESASQTLDRLVDSVWMVLSVNDPPHLSWYSVPVFSTIVSIAALAGVPRIARLPLSLVAFFFSGIVFAFIARGSAYGGRFSTIMIGAACAVCVSAAAVVLTHFGQRSDNRTAGL